ncbi:ribonuclease H-like domain-containing protein [Tanacetum coccineum]
MCDKKNSVLFTDTECVVLSLDFKLLDENHVLLRVPRKDNMYNVDLKNIVPSGGQTCLFANATLDESNLWHRRLGHINFKTLTKTLKGFEGETLLEIYLQRFLKIITHVLLVRKESNIKPLVKPRLVLVIKPYNKTPYELFLGRKPALSFMRPFGCPVIILNTLDHLGQAGKKIIPDQEYILLPLLTSDPSLSKSSKDFPDAGFKPSGEEEKMDAEHPKNEDSKVPNTEEPRVNQEKDESINSTNNINTVSLTVNIASIEDNAIHENIVYGCDDDPNMPNLEEIAYSDDDEDVGTEADINNLDTFMLVSPIPTTRLHKDHPLEQIIGDIHSAPQTRRMTKSVTEHGLFSSVQQRINHKDFQNCLFACFLSLEPKKGNPSITRSKLDRSYARRASAVQITTGKTSKGIVVRCLGIQACVDIVWKLLVHQMNGTLMTIWIGTMALEIAKKVTLGVSMAWAKGVTIGKLVRYETSCGRLLVRGVPDDTERLCYRESALSLDKLVMPPHLHRKFRMGVAIATRCRGYYKPGTRAWVNQGSRKIRIPVDMYPCRVEERLTLKLVKGEEVLKIETTVTAKDGTITKFPGKFPGYKPTKGEEEILKLRSVWEKVNYDISDSDSDLESMARSGPRDSEMEDTGGSGIRINA